MKVLICTPAFGGLITTQYTTSLLGTLSALRNKQIPYEVYFLANESLIPRARNKCAKYALDNHFTDLLFIDADMIWSPDWVIKLLESRFSIIGGTYPVKQFPLRLNFNALPEHSEDWGRDRSVEQYVRFVQKYAEEDGTVQVRHLPTGFLKIETVALSVLKEHVKTYSSFEFNTLQTYYDFFPTGVNAYGDYLSEDWGFCEIAQKDGLFPIILQTDAVPAHTGTFHFGLDRSE